MKFLQIKAAAIAEDKGAIASELETALWGLSPTRGISERFLADELP